MTKIKSFEEVKETISQQIKLRNENDKTVLTVSAGTCGRARGSLKVIESLEKIINEKSLADRVRIMVTGCHGFCEAEPNIIIQPQNIFYQHVQPKDAESIITETALNNKIIDKLIYSDPVTGQKMPKESDISFYAKQERIVMGDNALIQRI
jgi:NADH-quinone oxidoreductase subunit F